MELLRQLLARTDFSHIAIEKEGFQLELEAD
jgi:hypothetical protein